MDVEIQVRKKRTKTPKHVGRNVIQVLKDSKHALNGKWGEMISASLLYMASIISLWFFPIFGIVLSFFATGFMSLGYIYFTVCLLNGKTLKLESVFYYIKDCLSAFALRLTMTAFVFLWGLLLIVPGIIVALNYSFAMSVMCENPKIGTFAALEKSKKLVKGYRDTIFCLYLLMFFSMIIIYGAALSIPLVISLFTALPLWSTFVIALFIMFVVHSTIIMPYFQVSVSSVYLEAKNNYKEIKQ